MQANAEAGTAQQVNGKQTPAFDKRPIGYELLLLLITMLWGSTFVAQSVAMDRIGPFTYVAARFLVSSLVLLVISLVSTAIRRKKLAKEGKELVINWKRTVIGGFFCGLALFLASWTQQQGLVTTTVGEGSFISSCYIVFVPIAGIIFRKKPNINAWLGVLMALIGLYFISIEKNGEMISITAGNLWMMASAILYTAQIMTVDEFSKGTDLFWLATFEFGTIALLGLPCAFLFEKVVLKDVLFVWGPILYAALVSGCFCYSLQNVTQKHIEPTLASLIMGTEAVFAALSGALFLHEQLSARKLIGCGFVMLAILVAQIRFKKTKNA